MTEHQVSANKNHITPKQNGSFRAKYARGVMTFGLALSDLLAMILAAWSAIGIRVLFLGPISLFVLQWMWIMAGFTIIAFLLGGLYPTIGLSRVDEFKKIIISTSVVFVLVSLVFYLFRLGIVFSRVVYIAYWAFSLVFIPFVRYLARNLMVKKGLWGEPITIIGEAEQIIRLERYFAANPKIGYVPVLGLSANPLSAEGSLLPIRKLEEVSRESREGLTNTGLVVVEGVDTIKNYLSGHRNFFKRTVFIDQRFQSVDLASVEIREINELLGFEIRTALLDPVAKIIKRSMDILLCGLGLIVLAPLLGVIALVIKLDSKGTVLFKQERVGHKGKAFQLLKFRTMKEHAETILSEYLDSDPQMKLEWETYQKLRKDPRLTRSGKFLRRTSLDELPQLWNILKGEMSLVGPRPMMLSQLPLYGEALETYEEVRPGLTGLWQVSGRNDKSFAQRVEYDLSYVHKWSVWLDIYLLVKTFLVVFKSEGAA